MSADDITMLLSEFGKPASSFFNAFFTGTSATWTPTTKAEQQALAQLKSAEARAALKEWYASIKSSDPMANTLRSYLEREIGEPLPMRS